MTQWNIQDVIPSSSRRTLGSSRGFSNSESDADRRTADSSAAAFSMAMTGLNTSLEREVFLSRSFWMDRREDPKPAKGLLEVFGEAPFKDEFGVAFLLDPKGNSERRLRKAGIPDPAGLVGMLDGAGEYPIP